MLGRETKNVDAPPARGASQAPRTHTDEDRAEAHDLAEEHPEKVKELVDLWLTEAKRYDVLPLNDLGVLEYRALEYEVAVAPSGRYTYYPGTSEVPAASAANIVNVSHKILAEVEFTNDSEGVIVAQGSRFGGYSLFVKGAKLFYVYNFLGIPPEQKLVANAPTSGTHVVGVEFTKERVGDNHEPIGTLELYVDDELVASDEIRTVVSRYSLCGEGLCIATTAVMPCRANTRRSSSSRAGGSSKSSSTSPTTHTSTSSTSSRPRWPATDRC